MRHRWILLPLVCVVAIACDEDGADPGDASPAGIDAPPSMDAPAGTLCASRGDRCGVDQACCSVTTCGDTLWCHFWCCTPEPAAALAESPPGMQCWPDGGGDGYSLCCAEGQEPCFIGECEAGDHCRMTCCSADGG
jgi:hypothetical protein